MASCKFVFHDILLVLLAAVVQSVLCSGCGHDEYLDANGFCKGCKSLCDSAYNTRAQCQKHCPDFVNEDQEPTVNPDQEPTPANPVVAVVIIASIFAVAVVCVILICWRYRELMSSRFSRLNCFKKPSSKGHQESLPSSHQESRYMQPESADGLSAESRLVTTKATNSTQHCIV